MRSGGGATLTTSGFMSCSERRGKLLKQSDRLIFSVTLVVGSSIDYRKARAKAEIREKTFAKIQTKEADELGQDGSGGSGRSFKTAQLNIPFIFNHTITTQRRKQVFVPRPHAQLEENLKRLLC